MRKKDLLSELQKRYTQGASEEAVLEWLRVQGCTMADSVILLGALPGIGVDEARNRVATSETWKDQRDALINLDESFWNGAEALGRVTPDGKIHINLSDL